MPLLLQFGTAVLNLSLAGTLLTAASETTPAGAAAAEAAAEVATGTRTSTSITSVVSKTGLPPADPAGAVETPTRETEDRGKVAAVNAGKSTRRR